MEIRRLGSSDLQISRVVVGSLARRPYSSATDAERIAIIHAALDAGVNAIDTAPMYGLGESELLVGRAIRDRRERVVIMTKAGVTWDDPRGQPLFAIIGPDGAKHRISANGRGKAVRASIEASLVRLGVEAIDLLQIHHPDPRTPLHETFEVLAGLRREGKIRYLGVCNHSVAQVEAARAAAEQVGAGQLVCLQKVCNLIDRSELDAQHGGIARAAAQGVGVLAYAPLHHGLLSGMCDPLRRYGEGDIRGALPAFKPENRARVSALLDRFVAPIAERHRATVAQIAIAWVLTRPGITAVIAGASSPAQAAENAQAGSIRLDPEDINTLELAFFGFELDQRPELNPAALLRRLVRRVQSSLAQPSADI